MFTNYSDIANTPDNICDEQKCSYSEYSPYTEYDALGNVVGYFWHYGETVNLQFNIDGFITVADDSIVYTSTNDGPTNNTVGYIGQKAYNMLDLKSWTCSIINGTEYTWTLDNVLTYLEDESHKVFVTAKDYLTDKTIRIKLYNYRYEEIYSKEFEGNTTINFLIDKELSNTLVKGIYYCTLTVCNDAQCLYLPVFKDKDCQLIVK